MKMLNDNILRVAKIQRNSAIHASLESGQLGLGNIKSQTLNQNSNQKTRCQSENLCRQIRLSGMSYTEQITLASLNAMICKNNSTNFLKNDAQDQQQLKKQQSTIGCLDAVSSSQLLNEKVTKKFNKRIVVSTLKIRPEIVKRIEEEVDNIDCESIVNEELKKYRCLRTDSIVDNQINKEEILKELQKIRRSNSGMSILSNSQSNAQSSKQQKQEIKKLSNLNQKQGTQHFETEEESPNLKNTQSSFQVALTEFEEEMNQLNMNCSKRYDQNRRNIVQRKGLPQKQNLKKNIQYLSSEDDQDISNAECLISLLQNGTSGNLQKQNNQILKKDSQNKENSVNHRKLKMHQIQENKTNQTNYMNHENIPNKKNVENTSGNFGIFKNQFLKQMQSQSAAKTNFTLQESSFYMTDFETSSSKQSSVFSIQKNSCESDEILDEKNKIQLLLPHQLATSQIISLNSSQNQEMAVLAELSLSPNRLYSVQKHQEYLDKSCGNLLNVLNPKNTFIPTFSFGVNGYLNSSITLNNQTSQNQLIPSSSGKQNNNRKNRSVTPVIGSINQYKTINNQVQMNQSQLFSSSLKLSLEPIEKQNNPINKQDSQNYKLSNVLKNNKNVNQGQSQNNINHENNDKSTIENQNGSINNFRQKFLKKVVKDIHTQRKNKQQCEIGDDNNNTFQIRRIPIKKQQSEFLDLSVQMSASTNTSFYSGVNISSAQKVNVLNIENNDLKQNKDNFSSTNITSNQEKLNKLLKRKYKLSQNKKCTSNDNQNKKIQSSHSKILTEQDDEFNFTRNSFDSPCRIKKADVESILNQQPENISIKV